MDSFWKQKIEKAYSNNKGENERVIKLIMGIRSSPMKKRNLDQLTKEVSLSPSQAELVAGIQLSKFRSLHGNTKLSIGAIENIVSILRILQIGLSVFDNNKDAFYRWVKSPNPALMNYIPLELMLTIMGCNLVEDELKRIDYGILA